MPFGIGRREEPKPTDLGLLNAFARAMPADEHSVGPVPDWTERDTRSLLGRDHPLFTAFMAARVRSSFGDGVLRFLLPQTEPSLVAWNARDGWRSDWPSVIPAVAFASDWAGRIYLLAKDGSLRRGEPPVVLLDPTAGDVVVLDFTFGEFLGNAISSDWRNLLDADRLDSWRAAGGVGPTPGECISPKVPLFMGGSAEIPDLEVSSVAVVVSLFGQMWEQVKNLPPGTRVGGLTRT